MTIQLELSAAGYERLRQLAERAGVTVESYVQNWAESAPLPPERPTIPDDVFQRAKEATFRENAELYRRLAK